MARIENHKYSLEEAFRECFYQVPDYQREYVWTEREVCQLLDDITEQAEAGNDREYFVGTVLVSPGPHRNHFEVIDGQQRLTTFFLLLCALRNRLKGTPQHRSLSELISTHYTTSDGRIETTLKLQPRYENASEIMDKLVALDTEPEKIRSAIHQTGILSFGSLENLVDAYESIHRYLRENYESTKSQVALWGYLANNVVFIQISTDVSSALKIFETINERGIGLNPMDLLKNLLFSHVKLDQFTQLKDEWKKITKPLEERNEKPLRFLRYFLMANYKIKNKRSDSVVREDEIYEWLTDRDNALVTNYAEKPFDFVRKIIRAVEQYLSFASGRGNDGQPSVSMENLRILCGEAFSLHFVLLLAASTLPKRLFDHFVQQLESFLFYYIFTKTPTKELERNFSAWADELREIAQSSNEATKVEKLNAFVQNRFQSSMNAKSTELVDSLRRYSLTSMQKYRTRYLLAKLTQHVDMAYSGSPIPGRLAEYMVLEMEHILPDTPEQTLRDSFAAENPGIAYADAKNRLGNFTLLEKPINIVASNNYYTLKCAEYKKSKHYLTSSIAELVQVGTNTSITRINSRLKAFDRWSASTIDERQNLLISLSQDVWKCDTLDPNG